MAALTRLLLALLLLTPARDGLCQDATPQPGMQGIWKAEMPAGSYLVRLREISSVSQHEYVVEGAAKVSEVNVAANTSVVARFYFLEPVKPQAPGGVGQSTVNFVEEKAKELASRAGVDTELLDKVVKSYPGATHAHTVEYRVASRETLDKLFKSLERSFVTGRGSVFKP